MNIFKKVTFTWWQIGFLKLAMLSFGIVIGTMWPWVFIDYINTLLIGGILLAVYLTYVWFTLN